MKAYTDLEQSRKLAEILPLESADMYYEPSTGFCTEPSEVMFGDIKYAHPRSIRCWSLAALLGVIPQTIFDGEYVINITEGGAYKWVITYDHYENRSSSGYEVDSGADNLVDACYELVLKLRQLPLPKG
jgi:hypothetical protein